MTNKNLFGGSFMDMLDSQDPIIVLADNLPWSKLEDQLQNTTPESAGLPNQ